MPTANGPGLRRPGNKAQSQVRFSAPRRCSRSKLFALACGRYTANVDAAQYSRGYGRGASRNRPSTGGRPHRRPQRHPRGPRPLAEQVRGWPRCYNRGLSTGRTRRPQACFGGRDGIGVDMWVRSLNSWVTNAWAASNVPPHSAVPGMRETGVTAKCVISWARTFRPISSLF